MEQRELCRTLSQLAIQELIDNFPSHDEFPVTVHASSGLYQMAVTLSDDVIDIKLFQSADLQVIAWLQYLKEEDIIGFNVNAQELEHAMKTIILLDKMQVI